MDWIDLAQVAHSCKCGTETTGTIIGMEFLTSSETKLFKNSPAPLNQLFVYHYFSLDMWIISVSLVYTAFWVIFTCDGQAL